MFAKPYSSAHDIFQDREVLEFDYIPEFLNYRDAQMKELLRSLSPGLHGARPINTILRGLPGTGKTTCVKRVFAGLEEISTRMIPVYVNCRFDNTPLDIISRIHLCLRGHAPPLAGGAVQEVLDSIVNIIQDRDGVLVVCLDDANALLADKALNSVLFLILQMAERYPRVKVGIIATVNTLDTDLSQELDPYVMSLFRPMEIDFSPYSKDEVNSILQERIHHTLSPGVISDEILDLIVDQTVACGDLRLGLGLVRNLAVCADCEGVQAVSSRHVEAAFEDSKHAHLKQLINALSANEASLLAHIAHLTIQEPLAPLTVEMLFQSAQMKMRINTAIFRQWIRKFHELRLIQLNRVSKGAREKTRQIVLMYDALKVTEECR